MGKEWKGSITLKNVEWHDYTPPMSAPPEDREAVFASISFDWEGEKLRFGILRQRKGERMTIINVDLVEQPYNFSESTNTPAEVEIERVHPSQGNIETISRKGNLTGAIRLKMRNVVKREIWHVTIRLL